MDFTYNYADVSKNPSGYEHINRAAERLYEKLLSLHPDSLDISAYGKVYLKIYLANIQSFLQRNTYLLYLSSIVERSKPAQTFLEYGGGLGTFSLLAKEAGIPAVFYNDIDPQAAQDSRILARSLELPFEDWIVGDVDQVVRYAKERNINFDSINSCDVIEHIYDLEGFFSQIRTVMSPESILILTTAANNANPLDRLKYTHLHKMAEWKGKRGIPNETSRGTNRSYYAIRYEMIQEMHPELTDQQVIHMAKITRGLREADILQLVSDYLAGKVISNPTRHPTNTCNPYTGVWKERLLSKTYLLDIVEASNFKGSIGAGYYGRQQNLVKSALVKALNWGIHLLGEKGIILSPYIILHLTT